MTVEWPRQPTGPSSPGAAKVRALNSTGGEWQTSRPALGVVAKRSGDFRRVTVTPGGYLTFGYPAAKQAAFSSVTVEPPCIAFMPWFSKDVEVGDVAQTGRGGFVMSHAFGYTANTPVNYTYTFLPELITRTERFFTLQNSVALIKYDYYAKSPENFVVTVGTTMPDWVADKAVMGIVPPCVSFMGVVDVFGGDAPIEAAMAAYPTLSARVDQQGRPRNDIRVAVVPFGEPPAYLATFDSASFADPDVEFAQYMPSVSTENHIAIFARERLYEIRTFTLETAYDFVQKLWLLRAVGKDLNVVTAHDLTAVLFEDQVTRPLGTVGASVPNFISVHVDENLAFHMRTVALPGNIVLLSYFYFTEMDPLPLPPIFADEGRGGTQAFCCIARIDLVSMAHSVTFKEPCYIKWVIDPSDTDTTIPDFPERVIGGMTHIGMGTVIAKLVNGLQPPKSSWGAYAQTVLRVDPGTEALRLLRSTDGGATWTEFAPTGLPEPLEHGKFGDITVHKPKTADTPAVLMMNVWTGTAYQTFISKDSGSAWKKAGTVTKASIFKRLDGIWRATSAWFEKSRKDTGSFRHLLDGATGEVLADRTIPDRFTYKQP